MSLDDLNLSPAKLAEYSGLSTESQREWRHRGHMDQLGLPDERTGRFRYSINDAAVVWAARQILEYGGDRRGALLLAGQGAPGIIHYWKSGSWELYRRYHGLTVNEHGTLQLLWPNDVSDFARYLRDFSVVQMVDWEAIANRGEGILRELVRTAET